MEMESIYQEILTSSLWEEDLPEFDWSAGSLGNRPNCDGGLLVEDESFWGNEGFPLKEALLDSLGPALDIDEKSIRDENPFAEWLDERVDLTEFDELISIPEFDCVMRDFGTAAVDILDTAATEILEEMESLGKVEQDVNSPDVLTTKAEPVLGPSSSVFNDEAPVPDFEPENSPSSSEAPPSFFVEMSTTSPIGSPGNELIGQPQQVLDVCSTDGDVTMDVPADSNDANDSSSNLGCPSVSDRTKKSFSRKSGTSQRRVKPKPYSRPSSSQNSDDGATESSSSFDGPSGCSTRGPKERKRVQNRSAATRYRNKKRVEQSELDKEEDELAAKNKELSQKVDQLSTEIGYLKNLMRDMLISKGLLKK